MKTITITQKDIEKAKIQFSDSGYIIDELAYSAGEWTSNDLYENNLDYEPNEPYNYDYEQDLFEHTKKEKELFDLCEKLDCKVHIPIVSSKEKTKLQAGACMALNNPESWEELLEAYTDKLKADHIDGISEAYNKALEGEKTEFHDNLYREWLYGDHRNYSGVVYEIAKYYTESGNNGSWNQKEHAYTFELDENTIQGYKDKGYKVNQLKSALLNDIYNAGEARQSKDKTAHEARQAEHMRLFEYRKQQLAQQEQERKAKLLSMTNK